MFWTLATLAGIGALAAVAYCIFPRVMFDLATALSRRMGGLALAAVEVDGHRIPYLHGGTGEPLILLHGFAANKDHWTLVAPHLTKHFRVIAPDLAGFGDSSRIDSADYGSVAQIARVDAFADALRLESFHLGGNSLGGYLAAIYGARHSARVKSLWLLAPAGAMTAAPSETQSMIEQGDNPLLIGSVGDFERLSDMCFSVKPPMPAAFKRVIAARALAETPFNAKIFADIFAEPIALEDEIADLDVPALVVWGDQDRVLHFSGAEIVQGLLKNAETIVMPGMGHLPMVERPAQAAADFLRFQGKIA